MAEEYSDLIFHKLLSRKALITLDPEIETPLDNFLRRIRDGRIEGYQSKWKKLILLLEDITPSVRHRREQLFKNENE